MQSLPRVLLVESDRGIATALVQALRNEYDIDVATTGKMAIYKTETEQYEAIVMELQMPDLAGIEICQMLRDRGLRAPILILSTESKVIIKINLLDAGADDFLTKPFSLGELKARLRALTRREMPVVHTASVLEVGDLVLDRLTYTVTRAGAAIKLRRKEFALLECLMENAGKVVTRQLLTRAVWQGADTLWTNTVDVHIKHLRDKIDRPFPVKLINTIHGRGYKLEGVTEAALAS